MKAATEPISRETAREVMKALDDATKETLAAMGLEAFRFDADVCSQERWMRIKIKVRPVGRG